MQLCIVHQIRTTLRFVAEKDKKEVAADRRCGQKYPLAVKSWVDNWDNIMVSDSYVLGVSESSMAEMHRYDRMDKVIDLLFAHLTEDERRMIDRVRVYSSVE